MKDLDELNYDAFEWLTDYEAFRDRLRSKLEEFGFQLGNRLSGLVLGCGTSDFSMQLVQDGICGTVLSIDIEQKCVDVMRSKCALMPSLRWERADMNNEQEMDAIIGDQLFDLVLDKSTLDAILCDEDASGYFMAIEKYMKGDGAFVLVSLYEEPLLRSLFDYSYSDRLLEFYHEPFNANKKMDKELSRSLVLVKSKCENEASNSISRQSIRDHITKVLQWYHTVEKPFLSQERTDNLREAFNKMSAHNDSIKFKEAYEIMFTFEERQAYDFADFKSDLEACGVQLGSTSSLTFNEILEFFRLNQ